MQRFLARERKAMKKLFSAAVVCALAVGLTAAPSAIAVKPPHAGGPKAPKVGPKSPKQVPGTISVLVIPSTIETTTTTVTASGNVSATSGCRKDRTVRFSYVNSTTLAETPLATTVLTGPNGDYSVVLPKPTDTPPATVVLKATVDQEFRKVGSRKSKKGKRTKRGRQFDCMQIIGQSAPLTLTAPPVTP
jgi:hypothetical protein